MKYHTKLTYRIYWQHVRRYLGIAVLVVSGIAVGEIVNLSKPILYKVFFDTLVQPGDVIGKGNTLFAILVWIFALNAFGWLAWRGATFANSFFQTKIMADLANTCFAYMHKHSFSFFQNDFVGSLVKRVNRFYRSFEGIADSLYWEFLPITINVTFIIIVLSRKKAMLGIGLLVWIIFYVLINYLFSRYKLRYDVQRSEQDTKVTGIMADSITNQGTIKLFTGYDREVSLFSAATERLRRLRRWTWDLAEAFEAVQAILMIGLEFFMMIFAIKLWQNGILTVGDFVLIQAYLITIFGKFWNVGRVIRHFYEHMADAEEMTVILDTPHEIQDKRNASALRVKKGAIDFADVTFYYHKTRKIMERFNLSVAGGERIALVGPSGAGKSTIIKLLLRMHDVSGGDILIDGQKIHGVTQESLHKAVSLVPQDPILFHRTLMENIRYGKPDATEKEVVAAAKAAHCHEFIDAFPEKYNTYVGERGVKLSGGERQRVAIARAILRNAPILVLDEATSSLDSESEKLIQDALETLMKEKTVIVIAHRLSTIMQMDRIIVVDEGEIVEQGTHTQLVHKKNGMYHGLWKVQAGGFIA